MKILKNRAVAVLITIVVIAAMSVVGLAKAPEQLPDVQTGQWVYDGADVLSDAQEEYLAQLNSRLLADHGTVVAVATMPRVRGMELMDFCLELGDQWGLNADSFILVLDIGGDNYWLVQGSGLLDLFTDDMAGQYAWQYLENDFAAKDYGVGVLKLAEALQAWYDGSYTLAGELNIGEHDVPNPGFDDGVVTIRTGVDFGDVFMLIILIVILVILADALRYNRYRRRWNGVTPTVVYHPFIFGRPRRRTPPPPPGGRNRRPPTGGGFGPGSGGFGGGSRPGGFMGGGRPGGSTRPPSGGSRPSSGSFGGGRTSGGSFGGGRTGSFGGGRSSGGSFGGGRSGSFGGGRSSGGSFGGGRGGGRR